MPAAVAPAVGVDPAGDVVGVAHVVPRVEIRLAHVDEVHAADRGQGAGPPARQPPGIDDLAAAPLLAGAAARLS
jgi:hypothetical protein